MTGEQGVVGPSWLIEDMVRVETLLLERAGASKHPLVSEACTHLIKAGGKRLRPALVLLSSRAGEPNDATDLAAVAIELVHLATLCHDDVIDETATRRGVPTVHAKWGTEVAVLAGDYLFAAGCGAGAAAGGEVPAILADAIARVCEGQIVESETLNDPRREVAAYLATIELKTAALFCAACELGASTSGSPEAARSALVGYGAALGIAFQIVDDLLDLVGDPGVTGKELGTDLREGVFTMPVLLACARDQGLVELLASGVHEIDAVLPRVRSGGGLERSLAAAEEHARVATESLDGLPSSAFKDVLAAIAMGVVAQVEL